MGEVVVEVVVESVDDGVGGSGGVGVGEVGESGSDESVVGSGQEQGGGETETGWPVAVGSGDALDEAV